MNHLIDIICGNSRFYERMAQVQSFSGQDCYFSQFLYICCAFNLYLVLQFGLLLFFRERSKIIVGFDNMLRNKSFLGNDSWSQGSCEFESFVFLFGLLFSRYMNELMNSPVLLEAILVTKI
jgi:hypothetical protein